MVTHFFIKYSRDERAVARWEASRSRVCPTPGSVGVPRCPTPGKVPVPEWDPVETLDPELQLCGAGGASGEGVMVGTKVHSAFRSRAGGEGRGEGKARDSEQWCGGECEEGELGNHTPAVRPITT